MFISMLFLNLAGSYPILSKNSLSSERNGCFKRSSKSALFSDLYASASGAGADAPHALDVFDWMLWLNPTDNQGARFLRADLRAGRAFEEDSGLF